jgi:hypothetical protein
MGRGSLVQRARVGGLGMAGGLIAAGVAIFGLGTSSAVFAGRGTFVPNQAHEAVRLADDSRSVAGCSKSANVPPNLLKDDSPWGTMGAGLNCTGAPRAKCGLQD